MRQKTVCFLLPGHGSIREKWSNAAWKIYVAGPSNRYMAFVGSTSLLMASKREIYASEKRTELSQTTVAWSPDGRRIASYTHEAVQVWDTATGATLLTYGGHTSYVNAIVWSPDGRHIASGSADQTVQIWDAVTGAKLLTYTGHSDRVGTVAWSPDGRHIASGSYQEVQVWEASTGDHIYTNGGHSGWVSDITWSPDSTCIASAFYGVKVWKAV
jgi:WD40 repeat protein